MFKSTDSIFYCLMEQFIVGDISGMVLYLSLFS